MAGHGQLKFVMTECSKTQIRLMRLKCRFLCDDQKDEYQCSESETMFWLNSTYHMVAPCNVNYGFISYIWRTRGIYRSPIMHHFFFAPSTCRPSFLHVLRPSGHWTLDIGLPKGRETYWFWGGSCWRRR